MSKSINAAYVKRHGKRKPKKKRSKNLGPPLARSYKNRSESLKKIGFKSYSDYLKSDLWTSIRDQVLCESPSCIRCKKQADQVHHADYFVETLLGTNTSRLFPICGHCHELAEHDHRGRKTTLGRANRFLRLSSLNGNAIKWRVIE